MCEEIEKLEPNPAVNFSSEPTLFVRPDLYIYKQGGVYHVLFNKENLTYIKLSQGYLKSIQQSKMNPQEKKYIKDKSMEARFFLHALHQRQEQIKKIAYALIEFQSDFFEKGKKGLKPLTMADIADKISVHVSTVSRTVNNKYVYTPHGIMALKSFFVKGALSLSGQRVSVEMIKKHIKGWLSKENPKKPLSDQQIKEKISSCFQVEITRRRVSQYRMEMNLPSRRIRKIQFMSVSPRSLTSKASF